MNQYRIQRAIDRASATSRQRVALACSAALSIITASLVVTTMSDASDTWVLALLVPLAIGAVTTPDSHASSFAFAIVALHSVVVLDERTDIRVALVASLLLVFHVLVSLMGVTPHVTVVDPAVLMTWARRVAAVLAATWLMWLLLVAFDGNAPGGGSVLTVVALVVAALAVLALRARTFPSADTESPRATPTR